MILYGIVWSCLSCNSNHLMRLKWGSTSRSGRCGVPLWVRRILSWWWTLLPLRGLWTPLRGWWSLLLLSRLSRGWRAAPGASRGRLLLLLPLGRVWWTTRSRATASLQRTIFQSYMSWQFNKHLSDDRQRKQKRIKMTDHVKYLY